MKQLRYFLMLCVFCLLAVGCEKDKEQPSGQSASYDTFLVKMPELRSDSKSYVRFSSSLSDILYEDGDKVSINGVEFTVEYNTEKGYWEAKSSTGVEDIDGSFYCCSADGVVSNWNESNKSYSVSMADSRETTTGIVLAGSTTDNTLQFTPCFAVLVFAPEDVSPYTKVQVGFDNGKIPYNFTVNATNPGSISGASEYYGPASSDETGRLMTMKNSFRDVSGDDIALGYYYIAIPIYGSQVSTKLYFQYTKNGSSYQRVTEAQVTLKKGYVYIIPSEDISDYPFDENGASKHVFTVSNGQTVRFSAGNLRYQPQWTTNPQKPFCFASHQFDVVGEADNLGVSGSTTHYFDLFGWATSGYNGHDPYTMSTSSSDYYAGAAENNLNSQGAQRYDWGYQNYNKIWYGNNKNTSISSNRWRTLTKGEWDTLLNYRTNATNLRGYATIGTTFGFVILPDDWYTVSHTGVTFTPNSNNSYTLQTWDKMEKYGAIFLPACGNRRGSTQVSDVNLIGYYWSATHNENNTTECYMFTFTNVGGLSFSATATQARNLGSSVRLVVNAN